MKIVVFDLDETLGYFTQYGIFWDSLSAYLKQTHKEPLTQNDFDAVLNLFPEFLRPNILHILTYLKHKKKSNGCQKMLIYTNNTGPREWAKHIISYFERKMDYKLVDQIIAAFKINGKRVEMNRTSHNKMHCDLIKCAKLPADAEICFMDDCFYPDMAKDNIYYIKIHPYCHHLPFEYMLDKFFNSQRGKELVGDDDYVQFNAFMMESIHLFQFKVVEKNEKEYEVDKILGKRIISHLRSFFNRTYIPPLNQTAKRAQTHKNKTVKNRT